MLSASMFNRTAIYCSALLLALSPLTVAASASTPDTPVASVAITAPATADVSMAHKPSLLEFSNHIQGFDGLDGAEGSRARHYTCDPIPKVIAMCTARGSGWYFDYDACVCAPV